MDRGAGSEPVRSARILSDRIPGGSVAWIHWNGRTVLAQSAETNATGIGRTEAEALANLRAILEQSFARRRELERDPYHARVIGPPPRG